MPPDRAPLALRHAIALGLAQGPTELLPVSSSGHTTLIPWLLGWRYDTQEPEWRKVFEVALHSGAGLALAIEMREELADSIRQLDGRRGTVILLSLAPPALAGLLLRGPIERRLGGPRSIALALLAGAAAMALADARPSPGRRQLAQAGAADGLALGVAQALALIPGISRSGATVTAARARGFGRRDAQALSWEAALPVIVGASALEALRAARRGLPPGGRAAMAGGAGGAFVSTLLSARLLRGDRAAGAGRALLPYALYRCLLAGAVLRRLRSAHNTDG
ncbi:MAG TPA: undecaprenyl-diphosphate phosphatase [Solirubrobacteraceae bacterium]|jgi:undecaprenyl-diphosphatase|nr:undecaprenyl-diphosphate phosphatase [Solirubrobacteraceae bacterium]